MTKTQPRKIPKGTKFGDWVVLREVERYKKYHRQFICKNNNGVVRKVRLCHLVTGASSGKFNYGNPTHDMSKKRIYKIWQCMKNRCNNKNSSSYKHYGGRGIKMCSRWNKFENFLEDMKDGYKENLTLDRIDNNGNYTPENCRWATYKEQARNRRDNHIVEFNGENKTLKEVSEITEVNYYTLVDRVNRQKLPIEHAIL